MAWQLLAAGRHVSCTTLAFLSYAGDSDMKWYLVVERGPRKGQVIPVTRDPFLIGREACCHLRPSAPTVGSRHCALTTRGRWLFVTDCQASNGTFVNGRRLDHEQALQP